jgi:thioesterase domain-containing protein
VPKFDGAKKTVVLPPALRDRLLVVAAAHDSTLYMVLLATFQTFLHRLSAQNDVLVQTTTAGRPRAELESIVGYFASTLAIRTRFEDDPAFTSVLQSVRESALSAAENADVPFAELSNVLKARGAVQQGSGLQVMFLMQNNESALLRLGDATLEPRGVDARVAKMDLMLSTGEQREGLRLALEYRTDLFDASTADRFVAQITALLEGVAADPTRPVSEYPLDASGGRVYASTVAPPRAHAGNGAGAHAPGDRLHPFQPPRTLLEHELVQIWEQLFPGQQIGVLDDFFEIGGHSLLAMRMLTEVERMRGRRVPLAWLFESSTIQKLGARLGAEVQATKEPPIVAIQERATGKPIAFVHGDVRGGGWYCRRLAPLAAPESPFYLLPTIGVDSELLPWTIESMASIHVDELQKVQPHGPYTLAGFCSGGLIAFEMARQLRAKGEQIERLVIMDAAAGNAKIEFVRRFLPLVKGADENDRLTRLSLILKRVRWYALRIRQVRQRPMRERLQWVSTNVARRFRRFVLRQAPESTAKRHADVENAAQADELGSALRTQIAAGPGTGVLLMHQRAASVYFPGHFDGVIDLVWADERVGARPADPTRGWGLVADGVRVYPLHSSHLGLVTNNLSLLAGAFREALERHD